MTGGHLPDRWTTRDFPVLIEAAHALDDGRTPDVNDIAAALSIDTELVNRAWTALMDAGYLGRKDVTMRSPGRLGDDRWFGSYTVLTERGRRAVGIWPSSDGVDGLVEALRQAEDTVEDPDEKTLIRRAAGAVGSVSRDIMTDVIAGVVARQSGLA